ncbi:Hypothetical predicted protein [Olea europaea subsp. europaea]|uniref:Uncharacterized protein n=1 Tax=Olea europaea subsp. europaea TaxID=158383 RepID=A0A8S0P9E2_OLEEU|nr:Hypothetical predicted protein [Olea europaea subsp. europaea]
MMISRCPCSMILPGPLSRRSSMHRTLTVEMVDSRQGRVLTTELPMEKVVRMRRLEMMMETGSDDSVEGVVRGPTIETRAVRTSGSSLTKGEVEELLLDQRILLKMRLQSVKLDIEQYVTSKCKKLWEFLATLMAPARRTTTAVAMLVDNEAEVSVRLSQYGAHIAGRPDDDQDPMSVATNNLLVTYDSYSSNRGAMEPSHVALVNDAEFEDCVVTNGDGVVTKVSLPATIPEAGCALHTTRRRTARLRHLAPSTRTLYTRGAKRTKK